MSTHHVPPSRIRHDSDCRGRCGTPELKRCKTRFATELSNLIGMDVSAALHALGVPYGSRA